MYRYQHSNVIHNHLFVIALNTTSNCTTGHVRLTSGQTQYVGLVEICYGGVWKSICPRGWDTREAQVVCRQLGFSSIG